jgi:hypothetical protein
MASITLQSCTAKSDGTSAVTWPAQGASDRFQIKTKLLGATATVKANLQPNEKLLLGFIQICTSNEQVNTYYPLLNPAAAGPLAFEPATTGSGSSVVHGTQVLNKWVLSQLPCSDSIDNSSRPWYGTLTSAEKRLVALNTANETTSILAMTDNFSPRPLREYNPGGRNYFLASWKRIQKFTTWLSVVQQDHAQDRTKHFPLWKFDWVYDGTINFSYSNTNGQIGFAAAVNDTIVISGEQKFTPEYSTAAPPAQPGVTGLPDAAFTVDVANHLQSESYQVQYR